jgi:nucleoside-diphosphate-sugar epimerase
MNVLITGANGFIGKYLVSYLARKKIKIIAFTRSKKKSNNFISYFQWAFDTYLPKINYPMIDCAIHLAHDFNGIAGSRKTIKFSFKLIKYLNNFNVKKQFFISSCSAQENTESVYGKTKFNIEKKIINYKNITIIRPGLVVGQGGIYGKIKNFINISPVIILPDGGIGKVPIISINNFSKIILRLILSKKKYKEINLFNKYIPTLKEIFINSKLSNKKIIFSIKSNLLLKVLNFFEIIHMPFFIKKDNLLGFLGNKNFIYKRTKLNF